MKLVAPDMDIIAQLKREALDGQSADEWRRRLVDGTAEILRERPYRYRGYGPYWWVEKQALIDMGHTEFGFYVNEDGFKMADLGNMDDNLAAAWLYQNTMIQWGLRYSSTHQIAVVPDGGGEPEYIEYVVADDDMEILGGFNA